MPKQKISKHLETLSSDDADDIPLSFILDQIQLSASAHTKTSDKSITLDEFLEKELEHKSDSKQKDQNEDTSTTVTQKETKHSRLASATPSQTYNISTSVAVDGVEFELIAEQPVSQTKLTSTTSGHLSNQNPTPQPTTPFLLTTLTGYFKNPRIDTSTGRTHVHGVISSLWNITTPTPDEIRSKLTQTKSFFKSLF